METPLSKVEALHFVVKVLGIEMPEKKLSEDKKDFLNMLLPLYVQCIPFQNVNLLAQAYLNQSHLPTWTEIKEAMMSGCGGVCFTVGVFMKVLLETLGYNVHFVACDVDHPSDHISTIVRDLSYEGSEHIVDVIGYPNFEIVPLDFTQRSPTYKSSFCSYYYKRLEEKTIQRVNLKGMMAEEQIFGTFHLEARELSHFLPSMVDIYTNPDQSIFLQQIVAISYYGGKCIAVRGSAFLQEDGQCTLQKTIIDRKKTAAVLNEYFPKLSASAIADAIMYLKERNHDGQ